MIFSTAPEYRRFNSYLRELGGLCGGGRIEPVWSPDGTVAGFVAGPPDDLRAWRVDPRTGEKTPLVDVERTRSALAEAIGWPPPGRGLPFRRFAFRSAEEICFDVGGIAVTLDLDSYRAVVVADEVGAVAAPRTYLRWGRVTNPREELEVPSPDGAYFLSTVDNNIVARSARDGGVVRLTADGTADHQWRFEAPYRVPPAVGGPAAPGTDAAVCWSPDSRRVAAYKVDSRGVYQVPRVHYRRAGDEAVFRPRSRAGGVLERTVLYVLDLYGRPPVELDLGDTTDTYPVCAAWLPDSTGLLIVQVSRDCRRVTVLEADAVTGRTRPIFVEAGDSFVRHHHDFYFPPSGQPELLWLTPDGQQIIWQSERSGWRHFYLYSRDDGTLLRQLTDGDWPVEKVVAVLGGYLYFTGRHDQNRPYDLHFYRVPLDGGAVQPLTEAPGAHRVTLAPSGTAFIDAYSTVARPPVVEVRTAGGDRLAEVSRVDVSRLEAVGYLAPEEFCVTAADGHTQLWGVMFKPHGFDPNTGYPVIEYIYGGPQTTTVPHEFIDETSDVFAIAAQALAQLGYVTVVVDARGTPGRSKAFHDASYLRWANVLADDHAAAIGQLADRHSFIDRRRVAILGHSWGGYSAFRCLADRPDTYRAAVCSAPGFDPYYGALCEPYLDLPQRNPDGYAFADAYPLAAKIEGPVMIAAGTADHVTWTDAIKMSEELIRSGKSHEFVVLPEQYHSYDKLHDDYFWQKTAEFLARHLT